jgi:hypothetical protein
MQNIFMGKVSDISRGTFVRYNGSFPLFLNMNIAHWET